MVGVRTAIQRKLMNIIMGTSLTVLGLTCAVFIAYEFFSTSRNLARGLTTHKQRLKAFSLAARVVDASGHEPSKRTSRMLDLLQATFGLADDEVAELLGRVVAHQDLRAVVDLDRIGHAHQRARARLHP